MTLGHWVLIGLMPAAYLLGSVPFGLIVGRAKGVDPRRAGSGNIGATNVGRLLGGKFFALVFALDLLKGLVPMLAAAWVVRQQCATGSPAALPRDISAVVYLLWLLVGFSAILGHMFSLFLRFTGGKGVATSCGVVLGLFPYYTWAGLIVLAIWMALFFATRYVSIASMAAAVVFPVAYLAIAMANGWPLLHQQLPLLLFALLVAAMIVYKHRANIARLRAGTELRFGKKQ